MKRLPLKSLRTQTLIVLGVGLLASHLLAFLLYTLDRREAVATTEEFDIAERASGIVILLRNLPADWKADILAASDSRSFRVWQSDATALSEEIVSRGEEKIYAYLDEMLPGISGADIRVLIDGPPFENIQLPERPHAPGAQTRPSFDAAAEVVVISIRHSEGSWLNFVGAIPKPASILPKVVGGYLLSVVTAAAIISFWLVRRVTQPLEDFADAAERLGKDIHSEPLHDDGLKEVAKAVSAFNRMQERIAKLVENRMELLAAISHDLRTPVTQMKLRAELLENEEDQKKFTAALDEMEMIIATFHDYARSAYGSEPRSQIELGSLIESICCDMADTGKDVTYSSDGKLYCDCKRLGIKRAITNLIDNATKFGLRARVSIIESEDQITIRIDDDGPGISPAELDRVFLPFHRFEPSRSRETGGIGLGLSIAQAVAHDHGGDVILTNREPGGLRAEFVLPA